jgi:hypothetical protein
MVTVAVCQSDGPRPVRLLQPDGARSACLISCLTMRSREAWRRPERTSGDMCIKHRETRQLITHVTHLGTCGDGGFATSSYR